MSLTGVDPRKPHEPGACSGDYRSDGGEYWLAEIANTGEKWSCWSEKCVENWTDKADIECYACGHELSFGVWHYVAGVRKLVAP